jgi:hypothetical protein
MRPYNGPPIARSLIVLVVLCGLAAMHGLGSGQGGGCGAGMTGMGATKSGTAASMGLAVLPARVFSTDVASSAQTAGQVHQLESGMGGCVFVSPTGWPAPVLVLVLLAIISAVSDCRPIRPSRTGSGPDDHHRCRVSRCCDGYVSR